MGFKDIFKKKVQNNPDFYGISEDENGTVGFTGKYESFELSLILVLLLNV